MIRNLVIAETTPRTMRICGILRTRFPDQHWTGVTTGPFRMRYKNGRVEPTGRSQLNRVLASAADADTIVIATEPTEPGDCLAADLAGLIVSRYPNAVIKRVDVGCVSDRHVTKGYGLAAPLCPVRSRQALARRRFTWVVNHGLERAVGRPVGRAVLQLLQWLDTQTPVDTTRVVCANGATYTSYDPVGDLTGVSFNPTVTRTPCEIPAPPPYQWAQLVADGICLGLRSYEVSRQARNLVGTGHLDPRGHYPSQVAGLLDQAGSLGAGLVEPTSYPETCWLPEDPGVPPSQVDQQVRQVYRLVWSRALQSVCGPAIGQLETGVVRHQGATLTARSYCFTQPGHDRLSFGMLYRRGPLTPAPVQSVTRAHGVPEGCCVEALADRFQDVSAVLHAACQLGYVSQDGACLVITPDGKGLLQATQQLRPLWDPQLLANVEEQFNQIPNGHDTGPTLDAWATWLKQVIAVNRKTNASGAHTPASP